MGRRIVFFGNCQAQGLATFYRDRLSPGDDDIQTVYFLTEDAGDVSVLRAADVVVEQIFHGPNEIVSNNISADCLRVPFPAAIGAYFWPHASEGHVHNQVYDFTPYFPGGPWGGEMGDSYLNRLIKQGIPTDEAVQTYLALDVGRHANLDRLKELHLGGQRQRDDVAGIDLAGIIVSCFRTRQLFTMRGHQEMLLFAPVAETVFQKMQLPRAAIEEALAGLIHAPVRDRDMPMHPRLIEHYRLEWLDPEARYMDPWWGPITFREWVRRYMDYDWNRDLHEGIHLARQSGGADPLPYLERGIASSPNSLFGLRCLAEVYSARGRFDQAEDAMRRAARMDPLYTQPQLATLLLQRGKPAQAEAVLRSLIARFPKRPATHFELADLLIGQGRAADAAECLRRAIPFLSRRDPRGRCAVGERLLRVGEPGKAEEAFRAALEIEPRHADALWGLAEALQHQGRDAEAVVLLRRLTETEPNATHIHRRMGLLLQRAGDRDGAVRSFRAAVAVNPSDEATWEDLAEMLGRDPDTQPDALDILRRLTEREAPNFRALALLGYLHARMGNIAASEQSFRAAVSIIPQNADATLALINILATLGKIDQIMPVYERFTAMGGNWVMAHNRVGQIMLQAADLDAAGRAFAAAVAADPKNAEAVAGFARVRELTTGTSMAAE